MLYLAKKSVGKIKIANLVNIHLVNLIEDITWMRILSEINLPLEI